LHLTPPVRGSREYYIRSIGSSQALAQLYLEAGMIHLEGSASVMLLSSSSSLSLSSIRLPSVPGSSNSPPQAWSARNGASGAGGRDGWLRDQQHAKQCFDAARALWPAIDVPTITLADADQPTPSQDAPSTSASGLGLQMPQVDVLTASATSEKPRRRHKPAADSDSKTEKMSPARATTTSMTSLRDTLEDDHGWVLYIPGLIGAGTALVAVAVVGALSFSTWRKNQS